MMIRLCSSICILFLLASFAMLARADEVRLKDGRVIEAEDVWETGDLIWYRQGKVIHSVAKTDVVRITKPALTPSAGQPESAPAKEKTTVLREEGGKSTLNEGSETRKITRIFVKGGVQIDADSVWESEDRIGYRLGKMQTFIDRAEVERIVRDISITEEKTPRGALPLIYSTGHRGLDQLIAYNGEKYGVDPTLIYLVMREESRFNHRAVSPVGARGLMQLMPDTARRLGVSNIHDPVQNVDAGTKYLRSLLEMFKGDLNLSLAAYNAGENTVIRYGHRVPPYRETLNYVWRINTAYRRALAANQSK